jgi:hypothetical protein
MELNCEKIVISELLGPNSYFFLGSSREQDHTPTLSYLIYLSSIIPAFHGRKHEDEES